MSLLVVLAPPSLTTAYVWCAVPLACAALRALDRPAVLIGVPASYVLARHDFPGKRMFAALILVPMILPPFVGAIGFLTTHAAAGNTTREAGETSAQQAAPRKT